MSNDISEHKIHLANSPFLPKLKTVCKTTLCAEITLQNTSYTQLVQKGVEIFSSSRKQLIFLPKL